MSQIPKPNHSNWYIRTQLGETRGPFTTAQLNELLAAGRITTSTPISKLPSGDYQPLSRILNTERKSAEPPPLSLPQHVEQPRSKNPHVIVASIAAVSLVIICIIAFAINMVNKEYEQAKISATPPTPLANAPTAQNASPPAGDLDNLMEFNLPPVELEERKTAEQPVAATRTQTSTASPKESNSSESPLSSEELIAKTEKSVCLIKGAISTGSGFVFEEDKVMTNRHVIEGMLVDEIEVLFPSDPALATKGLKAKVLYEDSKLDVAILKIPKVSSTPLVIDPETKGRFRRGRDVIAIGNPGHSKEILKNAVSRGLLSNEISLQEFQNTEFYQVSISINPGNSGGPLLDLTGKVVGMITLKGVTVEGIAYAVPAYSLIDIIQSHEGTFRNLSDDALEAINKQHDARVIIERTSLLTYLNLVRFENYIGNVLSGINDQNLDAQSAFDRASEIDAKNDQTPYIQLEALTASAISKISSSRLLEDSIRAKISELWGLCKETRRYAEAPEGSANSMRTKLSELKDRFTRLHNELDAFLDLPDIPNL
jgi:S1-C subfamily serine protease